MKRNTRNCETWFQREVKRRIWDILEGQRGKVHLNSIHEKMKSITVVVVWDLKQKWENDKYEKRRGKI